MLRGNPIAAQTNATACNARPFLPALTVGLIPPFLKKNRQPPAGIEYHRHYTRGKDLWQTVLNLKNPVLSLRRGNRHRICSGIKKNIMDTNKNEQDLRDTEKDQEKLQPDEGTLDLPEVKDIPGQENIHPPNLREMADTTIASDDEEGVGIFDTDSERLERGNTPGEEPSEAPASEASNANLQDDEMPEEAIEALEQTGSEDDRNLRRARPDNKDDEGDPLNETAENSGEDLDVPGEELDDEDEENGEEDEENNAYSLSNDNE